MEYETDLFWERVKELLRIKNQNQKWLSENCDVSLPTLHNQISRKIIPGTIQCVKIAQALDTSVEYLVTGQDIKIENPVAKQKIQELLEIFK